MQDKMAEAKAKLKKKKKKLLSLEKLIKELKQKANEVSAQRVATEERATLAEDRAHRVIEENKKSSTFKDKMTEIGDFSYEVGFTDYRQKVLKLFSNLDLQGVAIGGNDEEGGSEQMAEEPEIATFPEATVRA